MYSQRVFEIIYSRMKSLIEATIETFPRNKNFEFDLFTPAYSPPPYYKAYFHFLG